jgi:hypothetical protein
MVRIPRATRFPLNLPVRYRVAGDDVWSYGMTVNISHTGVLMRSDRLLQPQAAIEMEVVLPGDAQSSARVVSRGSVSRTVANADLDGDRALAITIHEYDLLRDSRTATH